MARNLKLAFIFLFLPLVLMANESEPGSVSGQVIDEESGQPVSFATVALMDSTGNQIIKGVITDSLGRYTFSDIPYGHYQLQVTYLGYDTENVKKIQIHRRNKSVELPNTIMHMSTTGLDEVVVEAERIKGEQKIDRTVFTISDDVKKTAASSMNILQEIPSVQVGFQNDVSIEGNSNIQFYVDGILRDNEYVAQIDPATIDKVEVMTNPGVKYDANISGVINIVLIKQKRFGVSGQLRAQVPHPKAVLWHPMGRLEYGTQNFRVYVSNRTSLNKWESREEKDASQGDTLNYTRFARGTDQWLFNNLQYGFDIFLNPNNTLNYVGEWRTHTHKKYDFKIREEIFRYDTLSTAIHSDFSLQEKGNSLFHSVFYKHKFNDNGHEITMDLNYYDFQGNNRDEYNNKYLLTDTLKTIITRIGNNRITSEQKIDYSLPTTLIKHEMGYHSYFQRMDNTQILLEETESTFGYDEIRQDIYYNAQGKIKQFNWQAGVRAVYSKINAKPYFTNEYHKFLPMVSLQQNFTNGHNIKFDYRRSINRPGIDQLNPFQRPEGLLHYFSGNPKLLPELNNEFELSYAIQFKQNFISPKLFYNYTENSIQFLSIFDAETGLTELNYDNIGKIYEFGTSISGSVNLTKWWSVNLFAQGYRKIIFNEHRSINLEDKNEIWSYRGNIFTRFALPAKFAVFGMYRISGPWISYQRVYDFAPIYFIGAEKQFKNNLSMRVWYVPFINWFDHTTVDMKSFIMDETWRGAWLARNLFQVTIQYRFNYGKQVKSVNRDVKYEHNSKEGSF